MFVIALWMLCGVPLSAQAILPTGPPRGESELCFEGASSFGNARLFAHAEDHRVVPIGVEYDRHSWGGVLTARVDYVAELLPAVLLAGPARYDRFGRPLTTARATQYGAGLSPIGVRLLWRRDAAFRPFLIGKGGVLYFRQRALSSEGSHLNFSAQFGTGFERRLSRRLDLRLGFGDFHISNGDIARHNPGIDMLTVTASVGYRLGRGE